MVSRSTARDGIEAMAIDADGSVVVAGGRRPATGNLRAVLARFTPAGELDTGFDTDGWRDVPIRDDLGSRLRRGHRQRRQHRRRRASAFAPRSSAATARPSAQSTSTLGGIQAVTQLVKQSDGKIVGSGELPVGGFDYQFAAVRLGVTPLVVVPADTTPDAFAFVDQADVAKAAVIESAPVTITGITAATSVTVTGGEFSVGCTGTYGAAASTITNGQTICARHTSSATGATAVNTAVTIGGVSDTFSSTTLADPDTTPAAFSFTDVENADRADRANVELDHRLRHQRGRADLGQRRRILDRLRRDVHQRRGHREQRPDGLRPAHQRRRQEDRGNDDADHWRCVRRLQQHDQEGLRRRWCDGPVVGLACAGRRWRPVGGAGSAAEIDD